MKEHIPALLTAIFLALLASFFFFEDSLAASGTSSHPVSQAERNQAIRHNTFQPPTKPGEALKQLGIEVEYYCDRYKQDVKSDGNGGLLIDQAAYENLNCK